MSYIIYLLLPLLSISLVVLQATLADIFFSGRLVIELSLIAVIYAGFRMELISGSVFAFITGFVFDCIAGSVMGLFTFFYSIVFICSFIFSLIIDSSRLLFISLYSFCCALTEKMLVILFYKLFLGFDASTGLPFVFLSETLLLGLLAPAFFYLMRRLEIIFYGKPLQRAEHTGSG